MPTSSAKNLGGGGGEGKPAVGFELGRMDGRSIDEDCGRLVWVVIPSVLTKSRVPTGGRSI